MGLGSKLTDNARGIEYPTLAYNAIKYRLNREMKSEEMRLAYVAMTRAKEKLIITCVTGTKDSPRSPSRFLNPIIKNDQ